jgi:transposase-like protein
VPRCPVCESPRVVIVLNEDRRGLCATCGARWVQDGEIQRQVVAPKDPAQRSGAR